MMKKPEKFNLLHTLLIDILKTYSDNTMKTLASVIIALGWIVTSDKAREFLASEDAIFYYYLSLISILFISIIHVGASNRFYKWSQKTVEMLSRLNFAEPEYYEDYMITKPLLIGNLIMNLSLFTILFTMILSLR